MKKTIALLTGFMCIMSLTACGENDSSESSVTIIKDETSESGVANGGVKENQQQQKGLPF